MEKKSLVFGQIFGIQLFLDRVFGGFWGDLGGDFWRIFEDVLQVFNTVFEAF